MPLILWGHSPESNVVLIVGYQAKNTLGRRIVERRNPLKMLEEEIELKAQAEVIISRGHSLFRKDLQAHLEMRVWEGERPRKPIEIISRKVREVLKEAPTARYTKDLFMPLSTALCTSRRGSARPK